MQTTYPQPTHPQTGWVERISQIMAAVLMALLLSVFGLAVFATGYNLYYTDHIYPGISIGGVDVGGLTKEQAAARLAQTLTFPSTGRIVLQEGQQVWAVTPGELGLFLNPNASVAQALSYGRKGGPFARLTEQFIAWYWGANLPPMLLFDERIGQNYLTVLAAQLDKPVIEASLRVEGTQVVVQQGQVGRSVDVPATLAAVRAQVESLQDGLVPLTIIESSPAILDVTEQAQLAQNILSAPLVVQVPEWKEGDPGPWRFEPAELAEMLAFERVTTPEGDRYQLSLDASARLRPALEEAAAKLARSSQNPRFIFNDDTRQLEVIEPAIIGRALLVDESLQAINEKARQGEHTIEVIFDYSLPPVTDDSSAESLGITELVHQEISYFYGSSSGRIQNITTAASRFHGVLVPPGATFSMADVLGDVSLDTGYAEALIIYGNRTIKGVGGGVCQVSTTLFRTAFFGGFPIVERHPHAYRVSYYELRADGGVNTRLAGLDATVFVPVVDFKFTNDTPYWLLMETYVNPSARTLTWKFYSTSEGRTVEWDTSGLVNIVEPPDDVYVENPALAQGTIKQVDWAVQGADVSVERTVYRNGAIYFSDRINTHYLPWAAVYEYGPGTDIPDPDDDGGE